MQRRNAAGQPTRAALMSHVTCGSIDWLPEINSRGRVSALVCTFAVCQSDDTQPLRPDQIFNSVNPPPWRPLVKSGARGTWSGGL